MAIATPALRAINFSAYPWRPWERGRAGIMAGPWPHSTSPTSRPPSTTGARVRLRPTASRWRRELRALAEVYALLVYHHERRGRRTRLSRPRRCSRLARLVRDHARHALHRDLFDQPGRRLVQGLRAQLRRGAALARHAPGRKARHLAPHHAAGHGLALHALCRARRRGCVGQEAPAGAGAVGAAPTMAQALPPKRRVQKEPMRAPDPGPQPRPRHPVGRPAVRSRHARHGAAPVPGRGRRPPAAATSACPRSGSSTTSTWSARARCSTTCTTCRSAVALPLRRNRRGRLRAVLALRRADAALNAVLIAASACAASVCSRWGCFSTSSAPAPGARCPACC